MRYAVAAALVLMTGGSALGAREGRLTTQDYIDIEQLNARYARAIDECTNSGYDYADLYTDDGTFAVADRWGQPGKVYAKGREALANARQLLDISPRTAIEMLDRAYQAAQRLRGRHPHTDQLVIGLERYAPDSSAPAESAKFLERLEELLAAAGG